MANKMLIDAAHPEETRVVVLRGNRIEEFDFEAASKRQLRGNIYLAKVTRVEPSLQAAFIEYGGNRHGFLAFSEIHPDYYQIPVADRQALLEEEARSHAAEEEEHARPPQQQGRGREQDRERDRDRDGAGRRSRRHRRNDNPPAAQRRASHGDETLSEEAPAHGEAHETLADQGAPHEIATDMEAAPHEAVTADEPMAVMALTAEEAEALATPASEAGDTEAADEAEPVFADDEGGEEAQPGDQDEVSTLDGGDEIEAHGEGEHHDAGHQASEHHDVEHHDVEHPEAEHPDEHHEEDAVEQLGGDALEDVPHRVSRPRRHYKIQEVIKRRQVLLVQVVKEERGNKGAALTTYLSLAGRYSVLMPNTARGGGISRKITDAEDRKRLKAIAQELDVPEGMGIILRTAGAARGMPEVRRDFEYLMRMWETVRETTLRSSAPTLVYEEGSLIKRSIRDLFNKDVDEVIVSGEEGYREAKDFMRLLMPTHAKAVVRYSDPQPVFAKSGVEAQLDAMFSNQVTLRSGGYIVINQTEALVAIDVNSGRSTREHSIEDTALRTNLEAADEVARQLRLRDLAGLIVVDFIDMDEGRNDRAVERRIKDALKDDRARIQIGRISHFGLLEMSRQRMRTGVLEGSTVMCQHCAGSGTVRSMSSIALHVLRLIEDSLIKSAAYNLIVRTRSEVALYILNQKRMNLLDLESRFGVSITILADAHMTGAVYHALERGSEATPPVVFGVHALGARAETVVDIEDEEDEEELGEEEAEGHEEAPAMAGLADPAVRSHPRAAPGGDEGEGGRRRRRRRRRRGRDGQALGGREDQPRVMGEGGTDEAGEAGEAGFEQDELTDMEAGFAPPEAELIAEEGAMSVMAPASFDEIEAAAPAIAEAEAPVAVEVVAPLAPAVEETVVAPASEQTVVAASAPEAAAASLDLEAEAVETPRRRRTRRTARSADAETAPAEASEATAEAAPPRRARRPRARAAEVVPGLDLVPPAAEAVPAPAVVDATVVSEPAPIAAAPEPELPFSMSPPVTSAPAQAEVEPEVVAEPQEADPDRPKRSGWWQRAKATFAGS